MPAREFHFRPQGAVPMRWRGLLLGGAAGLMAAQLGRPRGELTARHELVLVGALAAFAALVVGARYLAQRLRGRGGPVRAGAPIALDDAVLRLPLAPGSDRQAAVPYTEVRSIWIAGRGRTSRLIIDTRGRAWVYPTAAFAEADGAQQLQLALEQRLRALPGGEAAFAAFEARRALAASLSSRRPWVTYALMVLIGIAFGLELRTVTADDAFGLLDLGGNAAVLVRQGQWYRLASAPLLHAGWLHLVMNGLSLLVVGTVVERMLGRLRYIVLLGVTGVVSSLASDLSSLWIQPHLYSVGVSGVVFGILGALAVLNWRYEAQLPGGYRLPMRSWLLLGLVNFIILPLAIAQIDMAAHIGGLLSGALLVALAWRAPSLLASPATPSAGERALAAILIVMLAGALLQAATRARNGEALDQDHLQLAHALLEVPRADPASNNAIAWSIAIASRPSTEALEIADRLARRAVESRGSDAAATAEAAAFTDTLATLQLRRGRYAAALDLEEPLTLSGNPEYIGQYTRFLAAYRRGGEPRVLGGSLATLPDPQLRASDESRWLLSDATLAGGALGTTVDVLVARGGSLAGLLRIRLAAGRTAQGLAVRTEEAGAALRDATLVVGQVRLSCACAAGTARADFYPLPDSVRALPQ